MGDEKIKRDQILAYLQEHKQITSLEAVRLFRTTRLGARIYELRQMGYKIACAIQTEIDPITKQETRFGVYIYQGKA